MKTTSQLHNFTTSQLHNFTTRKIIFSIFFALYLFVATFQANAQQWVSFGNSREPKAPEITLVSSTNSQVIFTCEVFGFYQTDVTVGRTTYKKIYMPGSVNLGQTGYPDLPLINEPVAYSGKVQPTVTVNVTRQLRYTNYMIYPAPAHVDSVLPDNTHYIAEVFSINDDIYNLNRLFPDYVSNNVSAAQFRDQRFINVVTNPLQWNPVTKNMCANVKCTVTVDFSIFSTPPIKSVGKFNPIASELFINYPKTKESDKTDNKSPKESSVQYYTLTQPSDADNIVADYLIITDQQFFDPSGTGGELRRLANHRANFNGYTVAVVNAQNIMSDAVGFPYEYYPQFGDDIKYRDERRIHEFIKRVYENGNAPNSIDGHLTNVLLVGDAIQDTTAAIPSIGVPASHDPYIYHAGPNIVPSEIVTWNFNNYYATDYYYSCVTYRPGTTVFDDYGDFNIGRLPVDSLTQLHNIVEKTINYENDYDFSGWKEKSFLFNSDRLDNGPGTDVHDYVLNFFYPSYVPSRIVSPYSYITKDMYEIGDIHMIDTVMKYFNAGNAFNLYYGHSGYDKFVVGLYNTSLQLTTDYLKANLNNTNKFGFLFSHSCEAGAFDQVDGTECIAEELTRYSPNKGFVGVLAASALAAFDNQLYPYPPELVPLTAPEIIIDENFMKISHFIGEFTLFTKLKKQKPLPFYTNNSNFYNNLFGDPALNIRSEGFYVSQNTTLDKLVNIYDSVHVLSGVTLTIPDNCNIIFGGNGRLIIDEGATINFINSANIYYTGSSSNGVNALVIKGNMTSPGNNLPSLTITQNSNSSNWGLGFDNPYLEARFRKLNITKSGIYVENLKKFSIEPGTYNPWNPPIGSIFNQSDLILVNCKQVQIDSATFSNGSAIFANYMLPSNLGESVSITNCVFTPWLYQSNNQAPTLYLSRYQNFDIHGNNISVKNGDGIDVFNSGNTGTTHLIKNNTVNFTGNPSLYSWEYNCLRILDSKVDIENNIFKNAKHGVSIFGNSPVTLLGASSAINAAQTQQIIDNSMYQVYVDSLVSFPTTFKYNYISNQSNNALVYCKGSNIPASSLHVNCNNWGSNFVPIQDLFPSSSYSYNPVWNYNGICNGTKLAIIENTDSPQEIVERFKSGLNASTANTPEVLSDFNSISSKLMNTPANITLLKELIDNIVENYANAELSDLANKINTRVKIAEGDYVTAISELETRLRNTTSSSDSVYTAIDLANLSFMTNEQKTNEVRNKIFQPNLLKTSKDLQQFEINQLNKLYPNTKDESGQLKSTLIENSITITPNPSSDFLDVIFNNNLNPANRIQINDLNGKCIISEGYDFTTKGNKRRINITNLPSGVYLLSLYKDDLQITSKRFIVSK